MGAYPEWRRVADDIAEQIDSGEYGPGDKLGLADLMAKFELGQSTIQRALGRLVDLGKATLRPGIGYFVTRVDDDPDIGDTE